MFSRVAEDETSRKDDSGIAVSQSVLMTMPSKTVLHTFSIKGSHFSWAFKASHSLTVCLEICLAIIRCSAIVYLDPKGPRSSSSSEDSKLGPSFRIVQAGFFSRVWSRVSRLGLFWRCRCLWLLRSALELPLSPSLVISRRMLNSESGTLDPEARLSILSITESSKERLVHDATLWCGAYAELSQHDDGRTTVQHPKKRIESIPFLLDGHICRLEGVPSSGSTHTQRTASYKKCRPRRTYSLALL